MITNNKLEVLDGIGNGSFMLTINRFLSSFFLLNWILAGVRYFNIRFSCAKFVTCARMFMKFMPHIQ